MSNWNRLDQVIQHFGLNVNSFAKEIGLKRAERLYQIKKGNYDISKNLANVIVTRYPEINEAWLLTGEGGMLKSSEVTVKIPLYNLSLEDFNEDLSQMNVVDELDIPLLSDSDFAFMHQGDSMSPEIENGSVVFVKQIDIESVVFGDVYFVVSDKMKIVRVVRNHNAEYWRLVAKKNDDYDDLLLQVSSVKALYKVKGVLSLISL